MALISIITPFRNSKEFILETAESILAQSYCNWEWILINDHSDENEGELIASEYADSRIRIMENEGKGIIDALITGLKQSKGDFITRMDADDIMPPYKLSVFLKEIQSSGSDAITGKVKYFSSTGVISKGYQEYEEWLNTRIKNSDHYEQIYRECTVSSANWLMKKETLLQIGGFEGLLYPEDYDLLFRWYEKGLIIKGVDFVTHLWREHPNRTSRNSADYAQDQFFKLKINRFLKLDLSESPLILNGTGRKGRLTAKILIENGIDFDWVSNEPDKFRGGIYGRKILGSGDIDHQGPIQILNAAKIDIKIVEDLYAERNRIKNVVML